MIAGPPVGEPARQQELGREYWKDEARRLRQLLGAIIARGEVRVSEAALAADPVGWVSEFDPLRLEYVLKPKRTTHEPV